jgi:hypothetical protein
MKLLRVGEENQEMKLEAEDWLEIYDQDFSIIDRTNIRD